MNQPESIGLNQTEISKHFYKEFRNENDQNTHIGLFGVDLDAVYDNPETIFVNDENDENLSFPVLTPIENLEWFNIKLIKDTYKDAKVYYFVHPPELDGHSSTKISEVLNLKLDEGCVIIVEKYHNDSESIISNYINNGESSEYEQNTFGGDIGSKAEVFIGPVAINGQVEVFSAPSLLDTYNSLIADSEIESVISDGAELLETIEGEEAESVWNFYKDEFDALGENELYQAGFTKDAFLDILKDPKIAKIVNKVDNKITTLMFFLQDFKKAPWFNKQYYGRHYPEFAESDNIFIFPGIVTDKQQQGNKYSADVINLLAKIISKRRSSILVTFECTEISATYIPKIVEGVVNSSGLVEISNLENPVSQIEYFAIQKS